ncbi:MAG: hypothetical protein R3F59_15325 [Myxococcota bacterium]
MRHLMLFLVAAGCAAAPTPSEAPTEAPTEATPAPAPADPDASELAAMARTCPAAVGDLALSVEDTDAGVAMTFTTAGDAADLQARVQHLADMYARGGMRGPRWQRMGGGMGRGAGMGPGGGGLGPMPQAAATVEPLDNGARLVLVPADPADLAALRDRAHRHGDRLSTGECPLTAPAD